MLRRSRHGKRAAAARPQIGVLVADDDVTMRATVRAALERDGSFSVCADAGDAAAAVQAALRERPDLCLLDIHMPGSGIAATREITSRLPGTKVIAVTPSEADGELFDALRAGASGYLLKGAAPEHLPRALHAVLRGEAAIPRSLVMRLVDEFRDHEPRRRQVMSETGLNLTSREWQVLDLLQQGLSTAEIAERLFISRVTVRSHAAALMRKLRVPDREALRALGGA